MSEENLNYGASPEISRRAKELRERMTSAEEYLWERIRAGRLNGLKFRRQHPASEYILDFYCHEFRLAIELDGEIHNNKDQKARDNGRTDVLIDLGINILRFGNEEVTKNTNHVLTQILNHIEMLKKHHL